MRRHVIPFKEKRLGNSYCYHDTFVFHVCCGFLSLIPSAKIESLPLFLLASFISGMGNAFLQASVNPYVTILGPIESAAKRISFMGIANKLGIKVLLNTS